MVNYRNKNNHQNGVTIIELIVVITVIAIIATITSVSYERIFGSARNYQRESNVKVLSEALEKYYDKNGEYPGCMTMTNSDLSVVKGALGNIDTSILTAPLADPGTNSLTCSDISASQDDLIFYSSDSKAACVSGSACRSFNLSYKDEISNDIRSLNSRHSPNVPSSLAYAFGSAKSEYFNQAIQLPNGNYIVVGTTYDPSSVQGATSADVLVVKYSKNGQLLSQKTFGTTQSESGYGVVGTSDGGYAIISQYEASMVLTNLQQMTQSVGAEPGLARLRPLCRIR